MNQELLNNPDVKEIAEKYAKSFLGLHWEDFVKENTKPKEWEIVEFVNKSGEIYNKKESGKYWLKKDIFADGCPLEHMLHTGNCVDSGHFKINSVKRSDGEVFTVGDKIQLKYPFYSPMPIIIKSFEIANDLMVVHSSNISGNYTQDLSNIEKIKQPLFKTIDGKDIYEGDEFYIVVNWLSHSTIATQRHVAFKDGFSTREKAREYVLMNKPCLSVNDVMSFTFSENVHIKRLQEEITELAKSKI